MVVNFFLITSLDLLLQKCFAALCCVHVYSVGVGHWESVVLNISQGSVATRLRCDGIFNDDFVTNLLPSFMMNEFENRSAFDEQEYDSERPM